MYDRFKTLGIPVTMTRTTDETLTPTERIDRVLSAYGNQSNVIVISNHINAGGGDGAEVIYALRNDDTLSNLILESFEATGQNVRKVYQRRLPSDTSKDYYFIHRDSGITEPIIVEYGFLDSAGDDVSQLKNNFEELSEAVVKAVAEYTGKTYDQELSGLYTVKSGDTLWSIAKKYNITVDKLKLLNNLVSNSLSVNQMLKVPEEQTTQAVYIVKSGDSLYSIATIYNTTVDKLKLLNNLTSNVLNVGQKLLLPTSEEITANTYIVKSGDSLYSIATKYNTTVDKLRALNNLTSNTLSIGQKLIVTSPNENYIDYVVKSGDNLYSIASKFNTSVSNIMDYNKLSSNLLSIGQTIKIPTNSITNATNLITYTVKKGDTLYSIARTYNTTVDNIKLKNNLSTNSLSIGQVINI